MGQVVIILSVLCQQPVACRNGFPDVIKILTKVINNMTRLPPGSELDMNNVTLRISLDVTGLVGFAKDFQTCDTFMDAGTDELFGIIKVSKSLS